METTCGERFSLELKRLKKTTKEVSEYIGVSEYHIRQLLSPDDENWYYYVNDYVLNKLKELGFDIDFLLYEVIPNCYKIKSIAIRLKQERKRKKISLQDIEKKTFIGHSRLSRIENNIDIENEKILTSWDLSMLAEIGLDVQYILFGVRAEEALLDEEKILLRHFRALSKHEKYVLNDVLSNGNISKIVNFNNNNNIYNVNIKNS